MDCVLRCSFTVLAPLAPIDCEFPSFANLVACSCFMQLDDYHYFVTPIYQCMIGQEGVSVQGICMKYNFRAAFHTCVGTLSTFSRTSSFHLMSCICISCASRLCGILSQECLLYLCRASENTLRDRWAMSSDGVYVG